MSQELAVKSMQISSMTELMQVSEVFALSGLFISKNSRDPNVLKAECAVKIMAGMELGIPAFAAIQGMHVIGGKPTVGARMMAAMVKASQKYDYKLIKLDNTGCILEAYEYGKKIGESNYTMADAKMQQVQHLNKMPRNMIYARAFSNMVYWYMGDLFLGNAVYTPDQLDQSLDTEGNVIDAGFKYSDAEAVGSDELNNQPVQLTETTNVTQVAEAKSSEPRKPLPSDPLTPAQANNLFNNISNLNLEGVTKMQDALILAEAHTGRKITRFTDLSRKEAYEAFEDIKLYKEGTLIIIDGRFVDKALHEEALAEQAEPAVEPPIAPPNLTTAEAYDFHKTLGGKMNDLSGSGISEAMLIEASIGRSIESFTQLSTLDTEVILSNLGMIKDGIATIKDGQMVSLEPESVNTSDKSKFGDRPLTDAESANSKFGDL